MPLQTPIATLWGPLSESIAHPPRYHAILGHLPIAISVLGVAMIVVLIALRGRSVTLRWVTAALYALGAILSLMTYESGEAAEEHLADAGVMLGDAAMDALLSHQEMAWWVAWMLATCGVLVALSTLRWTLVRVITLALALACGVGTMAWVGLVAHEGGTLVYVHGVGVPRSANNFTGE